MKIQFKYWKSLHSYLGLILGGLFLLIGASGFLMMEHRMFSLKDTPATWWPVAAWYESLPEEDKDYKEREIIALFTPDGYPVEVASDQGTLLIAGSDNRWINVKESSLSWAVSKKKFAKTDIKPKLLTWGKVINDLHTGKIFGGWLNLLYYAAALSLVGLTLSGVYLWYKPWVAKRSRAVKVKEAVPVRRTASLNPAINAGIEKREFGSVINSSTPSDL